MLLTLLAAATAQAADPAPSPSLPLWGALRSGMTKDEVKAAQPSTTVPISASCDGWLEYTYERKRLKSLKMTGSPSSTKECVVLAEKTLLAKYGSNPARASQYVSGYCGYGKIGNLCRAVGADAPVKRSVAAWIKDGVRISFYYNDSDGDWTVVYEVEPQVTSQTVNAF